MGLTFKGVPFGKVFQKLKISSLLAFHGLILYFCNICCVDIFLGLPVAVVAGVAATSGEASGLVIGGATSANHVLKLSIKLFMEQS
jgi:hypothetical protein